MKKSEVRSQKSEGSARRTSFLRRTFRVVVPITTFLLLTSYFLLPAFALAQVNTGLDFGTSTGLTTMDIRITVAKIIRAFIGLLGIVALGVVLTGGFLWMTAGGAEEKVTTAKRLLGNGVIGLTIILLSFSITQFVLSRLNAALGGGVQQAAVRDDGTGGVLPPIALPGGCVDPGGADPFVCSMAPESPTVGALVTMRGYRFGAYVEGVSSIRVGTETAAIARCESQPSWRENEAVFIVPNVPAERGQTLTLTAASGRTAPSKTVTIAPGAPGPGITCVIPNSGAPGGPFTIWGQGFGDAQGTSAVSLSGGVAVSAMASWSPLQVQGAIPAAAQSGAITVTVGGATSNPYPFTVTCSASAQCGSACCAAGQCVAADACVRQPPAPPNGVGASCDANATTAACEVGACDAGLRCDLTTCRCAEGAIITDVSLQTLVDTAGGKAYRNAEAVPEGAQAVVAPNGIPGNYLTIRGRGFGDARCANDASRRCTADADCGAGGQCRGVGRVAFLGGVGAADDVAAPLATCAAAWTDTQLIIAIPPGAPVGPMHVTTAEGMTDQTDDVRGAAIEHFRPSDVRRPGLCAVTPDGAVVGAAVNVRGVQFGAAQAEGDAVFFGDVSSGVAPANGWKSTSIRARVPNIGEGAVEVRVAADGEFSNAVAFTRTPEPKVPQIRELVPASGGPGQYVTIRGANFGGSVGKITFTRAQEVYEVIPKFPDACRQDWWRDSEVTVRIPAERKEWGPPVPPDGFTASGAFDVRVLVPDGETSRSSNTVPFTVTADPPTPGICAITPTSGPARTPVRIVGERFGAEGTIAFVPNQRVGPEDRDAGATPFAWNVDTIAGVLVPRTAVTGPVRVWAGIDVVAPGGAPKEGREGNASNAVQFEVRDCRRGAACATGTSCCADGTCQQQCTGDGPTTGAYQWTFSTGVVPRVPRIVEACDGVGGMPSPSPWDRQGQGNAACVNAIVRMQFTQSMDLTAATAARAVDIRRCVGGTNVAGPVGGFEAPEALAGWRVVEATDAAPLESERVRARVEMNREVGAHGGKGALVLEKQVASVALAPRTVDLPRDVAPDRHYFAVEAPPALITDTNGVAYAARVFVRGPNANRNPNVRAGIVLGRVDGPEPAARGWYQQAAEEVVLNGEWQELRVAVPFDDGPNHSARGFLRLYVTGPPAGEPTGTDDVYRVQFDDLSVTREGDPCAVTEPSPVGTVSLLDEPGRLALAQNVISVRPPFRDGKRAWDAGTWYEVLVGGGDAITGATAPKLQLDGDGDGVEGGTYRFRFRTREDATPCAIQSVIVTPTAATATAPGQKFEEIESTVALPGLVHLRADGVADPRACIALDPSDAAWKWTATQPGSPARAEVESGGRWCVESADCGVTPCASDAACGSEGRCDTASRICSAPVTCVENRCINFPNTATVRALRETPFDANGAPDPVVVSATLNATQPRTGTSDITVRFESPRVIEAYPVPACQEACTNARVAAVMNVDLDPTTVNASTVSLYRCTGESCRRDQLTPENGGLPIVVVACPQLPLATGSDPCAATRVNANPQVVITGGAALEPNTSYRVVLRGGVAGVQSAWRVPLASRDLNFAENGSTANAYSWTFRTRPDACTATRMEITPNPVTFRVISERQLVSAVPMSAADRCAPAGQPMDAESVEWKWAMRDAADAVDEAAVAGFTAVQPAGGFAPPGAAIATTITRTTTGGGATCTVRCLRLGSRRVSGICGDGAVTAPAEECERGADGVFPSWCDAATCLRKGARTVDAGGTCGNGVRDDGEECDRVDGDGNPDAKGTIPPWCDTATCLRLGSMPGTAACGNGDMGDGEDCDDGNTADGDGCSNRCRSEGSIPIRSSAFPNGIVAACGDGVVAEGEECDLGPPPLLARARDRARWASERCDYDRCVWTGTSSVSADGTCGNGVTDAGETCDDGVVIGTCSAASVNAFRSCTPETVEADCGAGGRCEDAEPVSGDGCSRACLLEGSSLTARHAVTGAVQPSMCGDGAIPQYVKSTGGEACDAGNAGGTPDAGQIVEAIGKGVVDVQSNLQSAAIAATIVGTGVRGSALIELQCGFERDDQCDVAGFAPGTYGVTQSGCCALRPTLVEHVPAAGASAVCRNIRMTLTFDRVLSSSTITQAVTLERCTVPAGCVVGADAAGWKAVPSVPMLVPTERAGVPASDVHLRIAEPLAGGTMHRITVRGRDRDRAGEDASIRTSDGVRLGTTVVWTFTTGAQVCTINRIEVTPPSVLLQSQKSRVALRAEAIAETPTGAVALTPVVGYAWEYAWGTTQPAIATVAVDGAAGGTACDAHAACASRSCVNGKCEGPAVAAVATPSVPAQNGETFARATATMTDPVPGPTTAPRVGQSRIRVLLCENPWPRVRPDGTWEPYPNADDDSPAANALRLEHVSLAYCRDQGERKVCRIAGAVEAELGAITCADDRECTALMRCLPALRDDLPDISLQVQNAGVVVSQHTAVLENETDELRKEYFFLPRGVSYCSGSQERCDPSLVGPCPAGEVCRSGQDAVGLRIYENERHVDAAQWFADQRFTDASTPMEVDGYRGIRAREATYVNVGNIGSIFTNIFVLSGNEGAVPETRTVLAQFLDGIRFNTDLATESTGVCGFSVGAASVTAGRCAASGTICLADNDCVGDDRCDARTLFPCAVDAVCRMGDRAGTCAAAKQKLTRDVRRVEDLTQLRSAIAAFEQRERRCSVTVASCTSDEDCPTNETCVVRTPDLAAGTYIPGMTTSRWPSWQEELGKLLGVAVPVDPLNAFGGVCASGDSAAGYDAQTCWNQQAGTYACPADSHVYQYRRNSKGEVTVSGILEFGSADAWKPPISDRIDFSGGICSAQTVYSATGRCGDGIRQIQGDEECDPPGTVENRTSCPDGVTGFQYRTCQQDCRWSAPSACASTCGNNVVEVDDGEACDVGARGGRVRPFAGIVPGISRATQYECSTQCQWSGGWCGDGVLQSAMGEQCDGATNVATEPWRSSATTQYACTEVTDQMPCRATGGFCGDRTVQASEQCDGDESRACVETAQDRPTGLLDAEREGLSGFSADVPVTIRDQNGATGSLLLTIETSNYGRPASSSGPSADDLSTVGRDVIAANLGGQTIGDFIPGGERGGQGIHHRLRISVDGTDRATVWALATGPDRHQITTVDLRDMTSGAHTITIRWDNDWSNASRQLDANLRIYRVALEGSQVRACGAAGSTNACKLVDAVHEWSACRASAVACGNGTVDRGEQCDDGGSGRCTGDLRKGCQTDADCGQSGGTCDRDADACTGACQSNVCGDAHPLAPTCVAGDRIGQPCAANADCGRNGECRSEACDLGASNWRAQCTGASDRQCVTNAECPYGRTCNFCVRESCAIVTKQGGFCGDLTKNGPEVCDFMDGTDQCAGLSGIYLAQCQRRPATTILDWRKQMCSAQCTSTCPPTYASQTATFGTESSVVFTANTVQRLTVASCRLLGGLTADVMLGEGIDIWPTPIAVVLVTDRTGSMSRDLDGRRPRERGFLGQSKLDLVKGALTETGGIIDQLFGSRDANEVRVGLVSYTDQMTVTPDEPLSGVDRKSALASRIGAYATGGSTTRVAPALEAARAMLAADTGSRTKAIVLLSDGALDDADRIDTDRNGSRDDNPLADTAATAIRALPNSHVFTILFKSGTASDYRGSEVQMQEWATDPDAQYAFAGTDVRSFYDQIVGAIAGVAIRVRSSDPTAPVAVTYIDESRSDVPLNVNGLEQRCAVGGQQTTFNVQAVFRGAANATVTLSRPAAQVCAGPPWASAP